MGSYFFIEIRNIDAIITTVTLFFSMRYIQHNNLIKINKMNKKVLIITIFIATIAIGSVFLMQNTKKDDTKKSINNLEDFKNITYYLDNQPIKINNENITYFGNEVKKDFNGDNIEDLAFIFIKNSQGSGVFYYITAAISNNGNYIGTNSILLGDRIAPQTTNFLDNKIVVNYADRKIDEPFTTPPSVGVSKYIKINNNVLTEIRMDTKLTLKSWSWVKTQYNNDKIVEPKIKNKFTITFNIDGNINITTDCNNGFGSYEITDNKMSFGPMGSTKMFCEGSQEDEFFKSLSEVDNYFFTDKNELVLGLKYDSGSIILK